MFSQLATTAALLVASTKAQVTVADSAVSACSADQYFDTTALLCDVCPIEGGVQLQPLDSKLGCGCPPGYKELASSDGQFFPTCEACGSLQAASLDKTRCMACSGSSTWNSRLSECVCAQNEYVMEVQTDSENDTWVKQCSTTCATDTWPGPIDGMVSYCAPCPYEGQIYNLNTDPVTCECNVNTGYTAAAGRCLKDEYTEKYDSAQSEYSASRANQISYSSIETMAADGTWSVSPNTLNSGTIQYYYLDAAVGCTEFNDVQKCQLLANLCVLQLYNSASEVCALYKNIIENLPNDLAYPDYYVDQGYKMRMPWLYYEETAQQVIQKEKRVKFRASFDYQNLSIGIVSRLRFVLAKYDLEGNFYGFEDLDDQLTVCKQPSEDQDDVYRIGVTLKFCCTLDMKKLISENKYERPALENFFFELYLKDYNDDLIDVPILIENTPGESGGFPNAEPDMTRWVLTRRFFLFDTISGIPQNQFPGGLPEIVRYPKKMTFEVSLDQNNEEMINVPYLRIDYRERTNTYIAQTNSAAVVTFATYYIPNTENFWSMAMTFFWILLVVLLIIQVIKMQVLLSRPNRSSDQNDKCRQSVFQLFFNMIDFFSTIYFWYLFFMIGYWFVFFKLQERVYTFMPTHETYYDNFEQYDWLFGWVMGTKLVYMILKVYFDQSNFDVYLIDWERPKPQQNQIPVVENDKFTENERRLENKLDVNAWRSLFLVNELNEIQSYKIISTELTLIMYGLFMQGFGLRYWTNEDPNLRTTPNNSIENWVVFFFVSTLVMYSCAAAQYVVRYLLKGPFPLKTEEFTDLCSVTNISVLIFDDSFGGYYIHGRSPYGYTEISSEKLRRSLEHEAKGNAQMRGLSPEDPDLQTYKIYIPIKLFETYRKEYVQELETAINERTSKNQALSGAASKFFSRDNAIPKGLMIDKTDSTRKVMNKLFMRCIEQVRNEPKKYIKEQSFIDKLFDRPPIDDLLNKDRPVLYKDKWYSFGTFFLMGMDWDFVMLDSCVCSFIIQVSIYDTDLKIKLLLGILVAYVLDTGLMYIRNIKGRRNLARHTLVDDKFLF